MFLKYKSLILISPSVAVNLYLAISTLVVSAKTIAASGVSPSIAADKTAFDLTTQVSPFTSTKVVISLLFES
jgi:hypothetical protein